VSCSQKLTGVLLLDVDAWEALFESFDLPTAFDRQPRDELDGALQIVLEPCSALDIEHVDGYPVIPRSDTIEYMHENDAQFQSTLAMLDRMYEDLDLGVHVDEGWTVDDVRDSPVGETLERIEEELGYSRGRFGFSQQFHREHR